MKTGPILNIIPFKKQPLFWLSALCLSATPASAVLYWDSNGVDVGAGVTPTGTWGTDAFWSADPAGVSVTGAWTPGETAVFSADNDAIGAFTVTVSGTQTVGGLNIEEGTVTLTVGTVSLGAGAIVINAGATLSTDSSLRISTSAGSTVTLDGGTLRTTNPGVAGTFFDVDSQINLGPLGGTFTHTTANILNIVQTATKITGPGSLTKTGAGVLAIASVAGNNTYLGGTFVNEGELRMRTNANTLPVTTAVTVNSPGIFNLNGVSTQIGSLSGGGLVGLGSGTLTVGDATDTIFSGAVRDTANAGAGGTTSVGGKITKVGTGTLVFGGLNIQTGVTTLNAGTITVDPGATLSGPTAPLTVNGGTLNFNNSAQTVSTLSGTGGVINLPVGFNLTTDPAASSTFSGVIAGAGGLVKLNVVSAATNRTLTLAGANTYDGNTMLNGGNIAVGSATALGSTLGFTEVASGAELVFTGAAANFTLNEPLRIAGAGNTDGGAVAVIASASPTISGPITLTGDATLTVSSSASATFNNPAAITATANQNLTLQGGANAAGVKTIAGVIDLGSGGLTKLQGGEWKLTATNNYSGATTISAGTLTAGANGALGTAAGTTTVASGAALGFQGDINYTIAEPVSIAGTGVSNAGAINNLSGTNRFAGPVTLTADSSIGAAAGSLTLSSAIDGAFSLDKVGAGTLILGGANTYAGTTTVSAGTLLVTGSVTGSTTLLVTGTLGGTGIITPASAGNLNVLASGRLSPGTSVGTLATALSGGGKLDVIGGVTAANSQSLLFELDTPASSDRVSLTGGALEIGTGVLEFDDFAFTLLAGFNSGDYLLFDGNTAISGTLGANTTGALGALTGELQLADGGNDLILHVVPEPGTTALLLGGLALLARRRRA